MCGRTPEPVYALAKKLGIEEVRFDWRAAIEEMRPDIVSIATPAAPHHDMAIAAAEHGCHVVSDKPLGLTAEEARGMLKAVENAGVKHAYAATSRYAPVFAHAHELLSEDLIGRVREIEHLFHADSSPLLPYSWFHQLGLGGGWLYQVFPHLLGQVRRATGATVVAATGEARTLIDRAPIGLAIHDFRDFLNTTIDREQAEAGKWGVVDADYAFTALLELQMPDGQQASALLKVSDMAPSPIPNHLAFFGTDGALHMPGSFWSERVEHFSPERGTWETIPTPQKFVDALPKHEDAVFRDWNQLFREFVADVRGEGFAGYPTFRDGWVDNEIIDVVRSKKGWTVLPKHPEDST
jgi:predicted dehydrogenase